MIPIFSYLLLKGRCADCGQSINPLHIQMEFASAVIAGCAFAFTPLPQALIWSLLGWQLLLIAVLDHRHFWLPDTLILILGVSGLACAHILPQAPDLIARLIGAAAGYGALKAVAITYKLWRKRDGLGAGDPKLLAAIGCWAGWQALPMLVLIAASLGLIAAAYLKLSGKDIDASQKLPLGTFLALATVAAMVLAGP